MDTNKINFIFQAKNSLVNKIIKYHFIKISIHTDDEKCNGPVYNEIFESYLTKARKQIRIEPRAHPERLNAAGNVNAPVPTIMLNT